MVWAIIKIYTSKCVQIDPQQLRKTSKFCSKSKKCDIEKTLGGGYHPLGSPKVKILSLSSPHLRDLYISVPIVQPPGHDTVRSAARLPNVHRMHRHTATI